MKTLSSVRPMLSLICLAVLLGNLSLQPFVASAKAAPHTGQLTFAKQVTVNGKEASAGQTLFNGDRVRVAGLGSAVINLGKKGRIELGKDTEFVLSLSDDLIGGDLAWGCLGIIASTGTNTSVRTNKGVASSDGTEPDSYFLGQRGNQGRVIPNLGEALHKAPDLHKSEASCTNRRHPILTENCNTSPNFNWASSSSNPSTQTY